MFKDVETMVLATTEIGCPSEASTDFFGNYKEDNVRIEGKGIWLMVM